MTHSTLLGIGHCRFIFLLKTLAQRKEEGRLVFALSIYFLFFYSAKRRSTRCRSATTQCLLFFFALSVYFFFTAQKGGVHAAAVLLHFASGAQDGRNPRKVSV